MHPQEVAPILLGLLRQRQAVYFCHGLAGLIPGTVANCYFLSIRAGLHKGDLGNPRARAPQSSAPTPVWGASSSSAYREPQPQPRSRA